MVTVVCICFVNHQYTSPNAGSVKQSGRQTNHCFQIATVYQPFAEFLFLTTTIQNTVWHNHCHTSGIVQRSHHVLYKHKIGFVFGRHPKVKAFLKLHGSGGIVLRKRWIGKNDVKGSQFVVVLM